MTEVSASQTNNIFVGAAISRPRKDADILFSEQ